MNTALDAIAKYRVVPVVVINDENDTVGVMSSLSNGGLPVAEITFRTPCAAAAIRTATSRFPEMTVGAGTVINREQAERALEAGAAFIVSPGFSDRVAEVCENNGIPYLPGCVTPTEIMRALDRGYKLLKFFPANVYGGIPAIKALSAPFPQVRFVPTGGVDADNINEYLSCDKIFAVGGSFMMKGDIEANCRALMKKISAAR